MAQVPVVHQLADSTETSQQTSRTSMETGLESPSSGRIRDRPKGNATLVESNLQSLPTWIPLSDWLIRDDDPFPYGKQRSNSSPRGG
ncbi:hypothetical protein F4801DRAFT_578270 [Xylaria longipes]|nr:hypothetical protein F4801DRAFT_578270 [Xylaria longipes]